MPINFQNSRRNNPANSNPSETNGGSGNQNAFSLNRGTPAPMGQAEPNQRDPAFYTNPTQDLGYIGNSPIQQETLPGQQAPAPVSPNPISNGGASAMPISLQKGQKIDLTKSNPGLKNILVGLGWDTNKYDGGSDFDLDASVFLVDAAGKVRKQEDFVFYSNPMHDSRSVEHLGDNRTGEGEGDDEQVKVNLSLVPADVEKIVFTVTIYEYEVRNQNFGQVSNAFIRIVDESSSTELIRYDLGEDFSVETAVIVGELYRHSGEWKFNAVGSGFSGGLAALCANFGIVVA